jgi:hypothetical protein
VKNEVMPLKELTKTFVKTALHNYSILVGIFTMVRIGYRKFCTKRFLKMLTGTHERLRIASALNILDRYQNNLIEFLEHIGGITDDEMWVLLVYGNDETKEQSK